MKQTNESRFMFIEQTIKQIQDRLESNTKIIIDLPAVIREYFKEEIKAHEEKEMLMYNNMQEKIVSIKDKINKHEERIQGLEIFKIKFIAIATTIMVIGQFVMHLLNKFF